MLTTLVAMVAGIGSATAALPTVEGSWATPDGRAVIMISRCGATLCGRLEEAKADKLSAFDRNNPSARLRNRPLIGLELLSEFKTTPQGWRGQLYNPLDGRTYKATLTPDASGNLNVKACLGPFCSKEVWSRSRKVPEGTSSAPSA